MRDFVRYLLDSADEGLHDIEPDSVIRTADLISKAVDDGKQVAFSGNGFREETIRELSEVLKNTNGKSAGEFIFSASFLAKDDAPDRCDVLIANLESNDGAVQSIHIPCDDPETFRRLVSSVCRVIFRIVHLNLHGRKAAFIDRDDTIAKDVPYCSDPDDFNLFDGVPASIGRLNGAGFLVIVITNQSGIGRGKFTEETLNRIHEKMLREISEGGGRIDDIFFCPHHPDDKCQCRKPNILMGVRAIEKYDIDPRRSFMIGDSDADVGFGQRLGCRTVRVSKEFSFSDAVDSVLG